MSMRNLAIVGYVHSGKIDYDTADRPKKKTASIKRTIRTFKKKDRRIRDRIDFGEGSITDEIDYETGMWL